MPGIEQPFQTILKACLDDMILSAWQNHKWFCHVWFFCLDGITMSCVISFNSEENWLGTLSYLIMFYICCIAIAKYMCLNTFPQVTTFVICYFICLCS